jgi:hypothetical protein
VVLDALADVVAVEEVQEDARFRGEAAEGDGFARFDHGGERVLGAGGGRSGPGGGRLRSGVPTTTASACTLPTTTGPPES